MATDTIEQVSTLATHAAGSAWTIASAFLIVIILFAAFLIFATYVGHGSFVALLLSFYGAYALYEVFPYMSFLPESPPMTSFLAHAGIYAALTFCFFLILRRVIISDFLHIGFFGLLILAILGAGFLIALASHIFSVSDFYSFTPSVAELFTPAKYFFWWFSGPAIGLILFAR